ncbi:benzoylformate decarboxylase [Novosphingobium sp. Leaf2]|uniref:benzoylformate decarboxylase n=1 Tax=Novosphingobium sp. Leaf2 TaxID=1735670 RepID=UPI0006FBADE1|nr:benzoylformate decarboxylase [Novosphingobium sp. Leaf2]KQM14670.1 benzoylformate decarboxylase [Novosphingobium sp. Leaf2]
MSHTPAARSSSVRDVMFDLFRQLGIDTIFGNPGSTELPMFRNFPSDFRYVLGLQEMVAVAMADGYAQATRNASIVNLHSAAGVGHALGNVFTAMKNKTPLVIIAGQQARSILPFDPFLYAAQATEFPKPYVKYSVEPARAEDVPLAIARAYHIAMQPPFGPTFVSVPVDDWDRQTDYLVARRIQAVRFPDDDSIDKLAGVLMHARNPAFVVGATVDREGAFDLMVELAERYSAKVFVAPFASRCPFPENHPLHAGFLPPMREGIVSRLAEHDVIVVLGAPVFSYHVEGEGPHIPDGSQLILVTEDPDQAAGAAVGDAIIANVKPVIERLLDRTGKVAPPLREPVRPLPSFVAEEDKISVDFLMKTLEEVRPQDCVIVDEAPTAHAARQDQIRLTRERSFFNCASGGLGYGLPAAVGLALGFPDRRVIATIGDGSSMYAIQALYSAAQLGLPVTFIIINNGSYRALEEFAGFFQIVDPVGTKLPGIDFVSLARSLGCAADRASVPGELAGKLQAAIGSSGPALLEVLTL